MKRPTEPRSVLESAKANWEFLALAAIALSLAYFFAYLNHPEPIPEFGARSTSGTAKTLVWCHDNPNTVLTASLLVGGGALVLYVYQVFRSAVRSRNF